jgi:sugar lactone lactonase YvrE
MLLVSLAGCASSGTSSMMVRPTTAPGNAAKTAGGTATAQITIIVPGKNAAAARTRKYVSPATQSLTIGIDGGTPSAVNLTPSSPNCSVPAPLDELTCTASLDVAPGSHSFALVTYDSLGGAGNELSANSITASIVADEANALSVTLAGIPAALEAVRLPASTDLLGNETAGFSLLRGATQNFNATAIDADGNYIIGPGAPTITAAVTGVTNNAAIAVNAATNGNPNQFALSSTGYGSATLVLTASPASAAAGSPLTISVPITSTTITSTLSGTSSGQFTFPDGIAYDAGNGNFYVIDQGGAEGTPTNCEVKQISPSGTVTTLAGNATCGLKDGTGTAAEFNFSSGIAYDPTTNDLYVTDSLGCAIRQVTLAGVVTTIAGSFANAANNGGAMCGNLDGPGVLAELDLPIGIAYNPSDENLYFTDSANCEVRQMTSSGTVRTIAGSASTQGQGYCPTYTDGTGTAASFNNPSGIAVDPVNGDLEVTDTGNCLIRQITLAGVVTTLAGTPPDAAGASTCGFADGTKTSALFDSPLGLAFDTQDGTLYVADSLNCAIRQVTLSGVVTTVAGASPAVCSLVNGAGAQAHFDEPSFPVYVASNNSLFLTDYQDEVIRQVQL